MINNIVDLDRAINWFNENGFKPRQDMHEFLQYEFRVRYRDYVLTAGLTYEWNINVYTHDPVPLHNALRHTRVAPWVIDQIKLASSEEEWKI